MSTVPTFLVFLLDLRYDETKDSLTSSMKKPIESTLISRITLGNNLELFSVGHCSDDVKCAPFKMSCTYMYCCQL